MDGGFACYFPLEEEKEETNQSHQSQNAKGLERGKGRGDAQTVKQTESSSAAEVGEERQWLQFFHPSNRWPQRLTIAVECRR